MAPDSRSLREGQPNGMDRMLNSFMHRIGKVASVKLFSFENDPYDSRVDLLRAHIFWLAGSGGDGFDSDLSWKTAACAIHIL